MKFSAFVTLWNVKMNKGNDEDRNDCINRIMKTDYVPIEEKQVRANNIIKNTYYIKKVEDGVEREVFHINSTAKHIFTFLTVVDLYTNIEIEFKDALNEYNTLAKLGAMDVIFSAIPEDELKEFKMIVDFETNDAIANEYENHAFIRSQVERFGTLIGNVIEPILSTIDLDKVKEVIEKTMG